MEPFIIGIVYAAVAIILMTVGAKYSDDYESEGIIAVSWLWPGVLMLFLFAGAAGVIMWAMSLPYHLARKNFNRSNKKC